MSNISFHVYSLAELVSPDAPIVYGIVQPGEPVEGGVPFVQSRDVGRDIQVDKLQRTAPQIAAAYRRSTIRAGDILFSLRGQIGQSSLAREVLTGANIARGIARIRVRPPHNPEFVRYALQSPGLMKQIAQDANGSTFKELTIDALRNLPIPVPSAAEQCKIAEILRTWDEAILKLEALQAAKSSRASGVAQILLAPSRAIGKHIPKTNWATTLFAEAFDERHDRNGDLGPDDVVTVGKYAIRKQSEHFTRSVASADLSNYRVISPGDFVYDPMSAYYGAIGRYQGAQDGIVSPAYRVIRLRPDIDPDFMSALLRSYPIRFQLDRKSSQGNKEGKRRIIQRDEFGSIEFNLPDLGIQRHIAAVLANFDRDIALATDQLDALRRQKRGLMQKLLTGEWRVNVKGADQ